MIIVKNTLDIPYTQVLTPDGEDVGGEFPTVAEVYMTPCAFVGDIASRMLQYEINCNQSLVKSSAELLCKLGGASDRTLMRICSELLESDSRQRIIDEAKTADKYYRESTSSAKKPPVDYTGSRAWIEKEKAKGDSSERLGKSIRNALEMSKGSKNMSDEEFSEMLSMQLLQDGLIDFENICMVDSFLDLAQPGDNEKCRMDECSNYASYGENYYFLVEAWGNKLTTIHSTARSTMEANYGSCFAWNKCDEMTEMAGKGALGLVKLNKGVGFDLTSSIFMANRLERPVPLNPFIGTHRAISCSPIKRIDDDRMILVRNNTVSSLLGSDYYSGYYGSEDRSGSNKFSFHKNGTFQDVIVVSRQKKEEIEDKIIEGDKGDAGVMDNGALSVDSKYWRVSMGPNSRVVVTHIERKMSHPKKVKVKKHVVSLPKDLHLTSLADASTNSGRMLSAMMVVAIMRSEPSDLDKYVSPYLKRFMTCVEYGSGVKEAMRLSLVNDFIMDENDTKLADSGKIERYAKDREIPYIPFVWNCLPSFPNTWLTGGCLNDIDVYVDKYETYWRMTAKTTRYYGGHVSSPPYALFPEYSNDDSGELRQMASGGHGRDTPRAFLFRILLAKKLDEGGKADKKESARMMREIKIAMCHAMDYMALVALVAGGLIDSEEDWDLLEAELTKRTPEVDILPNYILRLMKHGNFIGKKEMFLDNHGVTEDKERSISCKNPDHVSSLKKNAITASIALRENEAVVIPEILFYNLIRISLVKKTMKEFGLPLEWKTPIKDRLVKELRVIRRMKSSAEWRKLRFSQRGGLRQSSRPHKVV